MPSPAICESPAVFSSVIDQFDGFDSSSITDENLRTHWEMPRFPERWGIILAGGDGTRLQGLTRIIAGDDRPKQFCTIVGDESLLQQATRRAARSIAPEQTFVVLSRAHARYYTHDLADTALQRLIQPCNRGTAPAIIVSLLQIAKMDPAAMVAIFPSDHFYSNEDGFTRALDSAFATAGEQRSSIILLGAQPLRPEIDFGWIELGSRAGDEIFRVLSFHEKPSYEMAERLLAGGALLNTFVMVGSVNALIDLAFTAVPDLVVSVSGDLRESLRDDALIVPDAMYDSIPSTDFSRRVLARIPQRLLALRLHSMEWHDLGQPDRVVEVVRSRQERVPAWMYRWEATRLASQAIAGS